MTLSVRSVADVLRHLDSVCPEAGMFRGQAEDWPLLPAIARYPDVVARFDSWRGLHEHIIRRFVRLARPYFDTRLRDDADGWVHAQHYGLPTRLIDWTTNPLKALFFATNDPGRDAKDGVLWALTFQSWREDLREFAKQYWESDLVPFFPEQLNARLTAQEGCFLSYPLPEHCRPLLPVDRLCRRQSSDLAVRKFRVPSRAKPRIRRELTTFGAQYRLLFPDAAGVARGIKLEELES